MEISNGVEELSSCEKQQGDQNEAKDRLSDLPDSILLHILSFLTTADAVKTVLIRRFGNLWTSLQNLDFNMCLHSEHGCGCMRDDDYLYESCLINLIRHVLILHKRSDVHRFHLRFEFCLLHSTNDSLYLSDEEETDRKVTHELRLANEIDTWIRFAVSKNVKVLELDFKACGSHIKRDESFYKLPNLVLSSNSLTQLKLVCCRVEPKRGQIRMRWLKTLSFRHVELSNDTMIEILSGCPQLEKLSLLKCYGLHLLNFTSVNLKTVMVKLDNTHENSKLEICCPYVVSLDISRRIQGMDLKNTSSLVDATLDFNGNFHCTRNESREVKMLLKKLRHTMSFTMKNRSILVLTIWELMKIRCPSLDLKSLFLRTMLTKWHLPGIASLLRNSLNLEMLDIHIDHGSTPFRHGDMWLKQYELDEDNFWNLPRPSFPCLTIHLKTIRLHGYVMEPRVVRFVQFLLKNAMVLEKMFVTTKRYAEPDQQNHSTSGRLQEYSQQLLSFTRASDRAVISFF